MSLVPQRIKMFAREIRRQKQQQNAYFLVKKIVQEQKSSGKDASEIYQMLKHRGFNDDVIYRVLQEEGLI
ncbi:MAG: hypothetical protein Q6363_007775 [Candidatus Njordarchaeota archaeon]